MSLMKAIYGFAACALTALSSNAASAAPVEGPWGHVIVMNGGWTSAHLRVQLDVPFYNPTSCSMTDGYIVEATLPGAQLFQSMLITAFASGDEVSLTLDGCAYERPRVVAVAVRKRL